MPRVNDIFSEKLFVQADEEEEAEAEDLKSQEFEDILKLSILNDRIHISCVDAVVEGGKADEDAFGGGHDAEAVHECVVVLESAVHFPVADDPFLIPHSDLVIHLFCSVLCFFGCTLRVA